MTMRKTGRGRLRLSPAKCVTASLCFSDGKDKRHNRYRVAIRLGETALAKGGLTGNRVDVMMVTAGGAHTARISPGRGVAVQRSGRRSERKCVFLHTRHVPALIVERRPATVCLWTCVAGGGIDVTLPRRWFEPNAPAEETAVPVTLAPDVTAVKAKAPPPPDKDPYRGRRYPDVPALCRA
jgi:hypothetical protein